MLLLRLRFLEFRVNWLNGLLHFAWLTNKEMHMLDSDWLIADPDFRVAGRCSESHVDLPSRSD